MYSDEDVQYALEMTKVIREPDRRIDTFGTTSFEFHLVSELMDSVNQVRVRAGRIDAERPRILKPQGYDDLLFEGFGEQAKAFADWVKRQGGGIALVQYGFTFRKDDIRESLVHDPFVEVCDRVARQVESIGNPLSAVIQGVDDTWEICLLKFTIEMIQKSQGINLFDFKRRGLL